MELVYYLPNKLSLRSDKVVGLDIQFLTPYLYQSETSFILNQFISKRLLKIESEMFEFRDIYLAKNEKLLTAKASLGHKKLDETSFYAG